MKIEVFEFIEIWYNKKRRHSFLQYFSIDEFWRKYEMENLKINKAA